MNRRQYQPYISGLKGISCFFVMIGHFSGLFKYTANSSFFPFSLNGLFSGISGLVLNEGFWLYLFFAASGYLLAQTYIANIGQLVLQCIKRLFRLALPVLFSCAVILILLSAIGVHNQETSAVFLNNWFQDAYADLPSVRDLFTAPYDVLFKGYCSFNSPYWVLKDMFTASLIIYLWQFLCSRYLRHPLLRVLAELVLLFVSGNCSAIIQACLLGMVFENYSSVYHQKIPPAHPYAKFITLLFLMISFMLNWGLFFSVLIIAIPYFPVFERILSRRIPMYLGKISWGIYSFHWPLICSCGAIFILYLSEYMSIWCSILFSCGLTILLTLSLSQVYTVTLEKLATNITGKITFLIKRMLEYFHMA